MWIPPEIKDPVLYHAPTRRSVGYFGAVRLRDGKFLCRREAGRFNAASCLAFLKQLRRAAARSGRRAVIIIDNVRYHHARSHLAWRQAQHDSFQLLFLPPYSPDLNPVERVWKSTRRLCLHNRYFGTLEQVIATVEKQFASWANPNGALRKLCVVT